MRDHKIDLLRFIGLAMIILAHVGPPKILFQLRNFDVPLMVMVSGMSFGLTFRENENYLQYVWRRVKRLLFPVWIFLTIYFFFLYTFRPSVINLQELHFETVLTSYFLIWGIGYVWIIRVFLLVALVAPFIYLLHKNTDIDSIYLMKLLFVLIVYEICRYFSMPYISDGSGKALSLVVFYIIPYSLLFALGLRIPHFSTRGTSILLWFFLICFVLLAFLFWLKTGSFVPTQKFKYPPSIYYLSYATTVSIFLWIISGNLLKILEKNSTIKNIILFIAKNPIWIYLWHIPLVKTLHTDFVLKYIIVFFLSTCITFFQVWLVNSILVPKTSNTKLKTNFKTMLTG